MAELIRLASKGVVVTVDEALGGEIVQIEVDDLGLLAAYDWEAPIPASRSRSYGDDKLDWLSEYRGRWQLLVPNAGAACSVDGVPLPFHGEWSRTRVAVVEQHADRVQMRAALRLPLVVDRCVEILDDPRRVAVSTTVTNVGKAPQAFVWGEHPAFAAAPGDRIDLPPGPVIDATDLSPTGMPSTGSVTTWPIDPATGIDLSQVPTTRPLESVHYLPDRPQGWCALRRPDIGVALCWDLADFPHLWMWREFASSTFPFYGRAGILALEPASSWPGTGLGDAITRGQAFWLEPGEARSTTVTVLPFAAGTPALRGVGASFELDVGEAP
jgi:hypothetical protein